MNFGFRRYFYQRSVAPYGRGGGLVQVSSDFMNNRNLFSNHYLQIQISSTPEWKKDDHERAFQDIKKIYDRERSLVGNLNESQLEDRFFRSIFKTLLPHYEVQGVTNTREFPDYAFFPDRPSQDRAQSHKDTDSFFKEAFAVGEVKRWAVELDRFGKDRQDKRRNPSFQIWLYLHETEPRWGILSNGGKWRLYHQDKPLDVYYEVDLAAILEKGDLEGFKYFYYFFRKAAFLPNENGEVFLEEVLKGSANYAHDIGDNLKENVYRAMKTISEGFFTWPENGLDPEDPETRALVQRNTMILLYRFLFLLYAEGKSLLDLRDEQYREFYSFNRIKKNVAEKVDGSQKGHYPATTTSLLSNLGDLFRLINKGNSELGIPAYNGGLFDPEKHPYLEKWILGDSYLSEAIDLLSRSEGQSDTKGFVDYSSLEIKHLGSIYEGLLEYRLAVAEDDLVVSGGKARKWLSLAEFNKGKKKKRSFEDFDEFDRVKSGELYLATDKGDRKVTGSYYTPDYIVNYIVEKTVGPVVEERWKEAMLRNQSLIEATLSVKVLDPAMGSGHFLVGAVEFLAGKLMAAAERDIEWGWVEDQGQFSNEWAKREAVSHCVYGVDLNELAVELAKVSLWLTTIAKDKPLSFLDHRLKQGNSLVGGMLSEIVHYPGGEKKVKEQVTLPSFVSDRFIRHLIEKIKELERIGDDSLTEIKEKEKVFEEFRALPEYTKAKAIANVHTAVYFGNEVEPRTTPQGTKSADMVYHDLFWAVGGNDQEWRRKTSPLWFKEAQDSAEERSFFHWQLEFPEIFFEGGAVKENPGWDVVVGNPPYVRQETLGDLKGYFEQKFRVYHGVADLYVYFVELGMDLLRKKGGFFSYILANKWMRANYGEPLRTWMKSRCIEEIVDFGDLPVFPEATTYPCVLRLSGDNPESSFRAAEVETLDFSSLESYVSENGYTVNQSGLEDSGWSLVSEDVQTLLEKLRRVGEPLGDYVEGKIY
ncbi:MAG: Eco57I restriction-modification methylase domain-containing protein, partial [Methanotrichaceae archaeon]